MANVEFRTRDKMRQFRKPRLICLQIWLLSLRLPYITVVNKRFSKKISAGVKKYFPANPRGIFYTWTTLGRFYLAIILVVEFTSLDVSAVMKNWVEQISVWRHGSNNAHQLILTRESWRIYIAALMYPGQR